MKSENSKKSFKEFLSIIYIIFGVLVFRSMFFEPFKIPSGSMIPTLMIGDFILVNKFAYGLRVPFTDWSDKSIYITDFSMPKRGEVVVFRYPRDTSVNYIKRVIGLPGDTIEVIDKVVYINDQPIQGEPFDGLDIMADMDEKFEHYPFQFYKTTTGENAHTVITDTSSYMAQDFPKITVPEDRLFVMGDNRDYSADSRSWGFVPKNLIRGKAFQIWFSFSFPFPWSETDETFKFRPWRIGKSIN